MEVEGGDAFQAEHDGLRAEKARDLMFVAAHGVEVRNVQFIGAFAAVAVALGGNLSSEFFHLLRQRGDLAVRNQPGERAHADAVVRGGEVEPGTAGWRFADGLRPAREMLCIAGAQCVQQQRRQGKIIDHARFIAVAEVGDIFFVRHVGFGEQDDTGRGHIDQVPHQLHDLVGLFEVDAGGSGLLPEVGDGVEPDDFCAVGDVEEQDVEKLKQHIGVGEIEVDLVVAEGGPEMLLGSVDFDGREQRQTARPDDGGEIRRRISLDEVIAIRSHSGDKIFKPVAFARDVVEHQIKHELEPSAELADVIPLSVVAFNQTVIDHGKAVVGGPRTEGQNVDGTQHAFEIFFGKPVQGGERTLAFALHGVRIGDEHGGFFIPQRGLRRGAVADAVAAGHGDEPFDALRGALRSVEAVEAFAHLLELSG